MEPAASATAHPVRWFAGWWPLLLLPILIVAFAPRDWPPWRVMWLLAFGVYCACKWLTLRRTWEPHAPAWRRAAYLLAWPGMDARAFLSGHAKVAPPVSEWLFAFAKLLLGVCLLFGAVRRIPPAVPYLAGLVGIAGILFVLHFGLFHVLSCGWRGVGVDALPIMRWPISSTSVSEFWGRRWNLAFRDLTHRFLFRPLTCQVGPEWATMIGFLLSGLIHELVISWPAGGGYGGPAMFFLIQETGLWFERTPLGRKQGVGRGLRGWLFAMCVVVLPVPLLFHPPFALRIILPFLQAIGAVP